jgi:hypothetical protein
VWRAACELIGGEERMAPGNAYPWTDGFIVNLTRGADQPWAPPSGDSPGWHVDGSWFRHYLDSPEQGPLTIVLWTGPRTRITGDALAQEHERTKVEERQRMAAAGQADG